MSTFLPHWNNKNIRIFYLNTILTNAWFVLPNWMFLYALYISRQQIGMVEAIGIILGVLLEVPTGMISDVFGKKRTLIAGNAIIALSALVVALAHSYPAFLIGNCLVFVGFAFNSGSFEAFAYDSLVDMGKQDDYAKVTAKSTALALAASCVTIFVGGLLFALNPTYPFYAWIITSLIASVLFFFAHEPHVDTLHITFADKAKKLKDGVFTIFSNKFTNIIFPIIALAIIAKLNQGVVRQSMAMHFGFNGETFAYILALSMIPALFIAGKFDVIRKKVGTTALLTGLLITFSLLFVYGALTSTQMFGLPYFIIYMAIERLAGQINTVAANERIESHHRATALSVIALIAFIPYVVLMFSFSDYTAMDKIHLLMFFFAGIATLAGTYSFYTLIWNKK